MLVLGISDKRPRTVVGSNFAEGVEGALLDRTYADIGIRVRHEVLLDTNGKRVFILHIPSRPIGKIMKFEGVGLMRVGESLREMSDQETLSILSEQEPDFSAKICQDLNIADLDTAAIEKMKNAYAIKQKNPSFASLTNIQVLIDLKLLDNNKLNYAALILLAKKEIIEQYLPQAKIIWEFRFTEAQTNYDFRETINEPLFIAIDEIWTLVNNKNADIPVTNGAYISRLKTFNQEVIREAILNAIAHRDYSITSEVVIKQFPKKIVISNPGGFPKGVTIDNLLTISSTPRSRLMAEVLEKTGLVERSGQGVDKIYLITLSEGKAEPDYKDSDILQVTLKLDGEVKDKAFTILITEIQVSRSENQKLSVEEIVGLHKIKSGSFNQLKPELLDRLVREGLIKKASGHTKRYLLPETYYQLSSKEQKIGSRYIAIEVEQFLLVIQGQKIKIGELEIELSGSLNRNQIKYLITKLYEDAIISSVGQGRGTRYILRELYQNLKGDTLVSTAISYLREKYDSK